jgi:hypothetical protein
VGSSLLHLGDRTSRYRESYGRAPAHYDPESRNSETPISLRLVGFREFASCDNIQLCPRTPKSRYSILRNPEMSDSDTFLGAGPTTRLLFSTSFRDFDSRNSEMVNAVDFYVDSVPPVHLAGSYGPTQSYRSFTASRFAIS